jgi:hydrogenase expression/formation protein HypC
MCLAIPGKVTSVEGLAARVDFRGITISVRTDLLPDTAAGDWILVHAGFAIQRLEPDEALAALETIAEAFDVAGDAVPGEPSRPDPSGGTARGDA